MQLGLVSLPLPRLVRKTKLNVAQMMTSTTKDTEKLAKGPSTHLALIFGLIEIDACHERV